jgi:hypothetical protein
MPTSLRKAAAVFIRENHQPEIGKCIQLPAGAEPVEEAIIEPRADAADRAIRLSPRDPFSAIYYGVAGYAAFVERDYGESIRLCRESIRQRNDFVGAHRVITAAAWHGR